ncbi:MAG TPA: sigma-54 dependent transcriptional regulator [Candidatus Binatia bacterium]|jgi:two-component system response regulator GlrR
MSAGNLLVVDDDQNLIELIGLKLKAEGYEVTTAATGQEAVQAAKAAIFDLCIVDLRLSDQDGISVMRELHSINPGMRVIILTGYGTVESAVQAMQEGAYSYLSKPFNTQELLLQISRALENRRLNSEIQRLKGLLEQAYDFPNIVAKSGKMRSVLDIVSRIADTESTIYLQGESGTGKELIAKAIYLASSRRDKPFVAVNCAALPEPLLESELFGHEKGSFTGADKSTRGLLSQANNGTFFLDEIGDMPLSIQAKLLRALQDKQFYPVGSERPVAVNVRIIVATNKNLEEEVAKGNFRLDLFYRLHVIPIHLPPLRERKEDIPLLADRFLKQISQQMKKKIKGITPEAMRKLMLYDWPGNVRELENTLEYAVAMTRHDTLTEDSILHTKGTMANSSRTEDLATFVNGTKGPVKSYKSAKYEFEKGYLVHLLKLCGGKASEAAKLAGKSRTDFYELLRKHEIKIDDFRRSELMQG